MNDPDAVFYARHGVCRRLSILYYSIAGIYEIFPPSQKELLEKEELYKADINLHAFMLNCSGILDNLAWVIAHEQRLLKENKLDNHHQIGFFRREFRKHLNDDFRKFIVKHKKWHDEYLNEYRDRLVHRIPFYIPPSGLSDDEVVEYNRINEQMYKLSLVDQLDEFEELQRKRNALGSPLPMFATGEKDELRPMKLHPQLIADFKTVVEILTKYLRYYGN